MKYIGIDPGSDGAIAWIDTDMDLLSYCVFPKIANKETDHSGIAALLRKTYEPGDILVLEDVHAVFGSAAGATFTFGHNCGFIEGVLVGAQIPFIKIAPKKWQAFCYQGISSIRKLSKGVTKSGEPKKGSVDTKATSLLAAKRLFPGHSFLKSERSHIPHNGIVDASLMAFYAKNHFK